MKWTVGLATCVSVPVERGFHNDIALQTPYPVSVQVHSKRRRYGCSKTSIVDLCESYRVVIRRGSAGEDDAPLPLGQPPDNDMTELDLIVSSWVHFEMV